MIVSQISQNKELGKQRLKEFLGHSPLEVLMGAFLGILVGIIGNLWRWV
ncbi:MAG: divergent PAP2 family protein [candidate division WOR-3 bacterium]